VPGEHREKLILDDNSAAGRLYGPGNSHLKRLSTELGLEIGSRGNELNLASDDPSALALGKRIVEELYALAKKNYQLTASDVDRAIAVLRQDDRAHLGHIFLDTVFVSSRGRNVGPKGIAQKEYIDAIRANDIVFGVGPAGTGKCLKGDSLVLSSRGLVPIEELAAGTAPDSYTPMELTISGLCGPEKASHFYNGGVSATKKIKTRFGYEIEVTPEHPLLSLTPGGDLAWCRADELRPGDHVAIQRGQQMFGSETAIHFEYKPASANRTKPVKVEKLDEDLGYLLGLLTGDGCLSANNVVCLTTADQEISEFFHRVALRFGLHVIHNRVKRPFHHNIQSVQFHQLLVHLGMSTAYAAEKRIPKAVLRAPKEIVVAFLRGLFDTDGTVERRGGYPSLLSASKRLIDEVQILLLNFGILASKRERLIKYKDERRAYYEIEMRGADAERFFEEIGFGLPRKQALRKAQARNSNIDVVPNLGWLLRAATREVTLPRAMHEQLGDYRIERRQPSYTKLAELLELLQAARLAEAYQRLAALASLKLFWAEIVEIQEGEAQVYDLSVPGTHSFCANGFVNHNTYLAMAMAVAALSRKEVKRIILCRPAVEAGEKLGFLPGDLAEKVNPYLRPLYDALHDMMEIERAQGLLAEGVIEVAPLAFMRGRAQPTRSRVLTHLGWREIGSLEVGDYVIGSDGRPTQVLGVYPQGKKEVFRVTATDGASTLCCAEHLWAVYTASDRRRGKPARVLETREMMGKLRVFHQHRYELPVLSAPVYFPEQEVPVEPYALGLLLGDGCITGKTTPSFATADVELVSSLGAGLEGVAVTHKGGVDYTLQHGRGRGRSPNPLTDALRELGLWGTRSSSKFVPEEYLHNSPEVRLAVLQGLLDTDGGPVSQEGRSCRVQ
jgi:phosphate starvation-inducible protein PhoH/intein/homing endonuclease